MTSQRLRGQLIFVSDLNRMSYSAVRLERGQIWQNKTTQAHQIHRHKPTLINYQIYTYTV